MCKLVKMREIPVTQMSPSASAIDQSYMSATVLTLKIMEVAAAAGVDWKTTSGWELDSIPEYHVQGSHQIAK